MNLVSSDTFEITTPSLDLECFLVPWDRAAFGFAVAQIQTLAVSDPRDAVAEYRRVQEWLDANDVRIASCRLPHERLVESMFLESRGFRFIEMVLHPRIENLEQCDTRAGDLSVHEVAQEDLPELVQIAENAFGFDRYHMDPRLDRRLADARYGRWVANSLNQPRQQLLKLQDGDRTVALFIIEDLPDGGTYWHLTAVAPVWQGQGYGRRAWLTMVDWHRSQSRRYVGTTVAARNVAILNLYAVLGFRFLPPEMTFHWVRETA